MSLLAELNRRNVFRVAGAYLAVAWLVVQVADTVLPLYGFGNEVVRVVVALLAIGFVPTLVLAWVFEITPSGVKREREVDRSQSITPRTGRSLDRIIIGVLIVALTFFLVDRFLIEPDRIETAFKQGQSAALEIADDGASIVVLPFANMSADTDHEFFSDGISEELLNLLARIPQLRVVSRSSAFSFKGQNIAVPEIAKRLNVAHVLEGSVRRSGDKVRITAQLIDARTDSHLWSVTYDREFDDIFAIQDEIAAEVVQRLQVTLVGDMPRVQTTNRRAYLRYLQGEALVAISSADAFEKAIDHFHGAVDIDPQFVNAWNALASAYATQAVIGLRPFDEGLDLAMNAAQHALAVDGDNAGARCVVAAIGIMRLENLEETSAHIGAALRREPANVACLNEAARVLAATGRTDRALEISYFLTMRDPLDAGGRVGLGLHYAMTGRWEEAMAEYRRALELSPSGSVVATQAGFAHLGRNAGGDAQAALELFQKEAIAGWRLEGTALAQYALGNDVESAAALDELIRDHGEGWPFNIACVYAYRGEADSAFEWLNRAIELGDTGLATARVEPLLRRLHEDTRWEPFLEKIGLGSAVVAAINLNVSLPRQ